MRRTYVIDGQHITVPVPDFNLLRERSEADARLVQGEDSIAKRDLPPSNVRLVQVGDHSPEPSAIARRRAAERFAVRKVAACAEEILALRDRLFDTSLRLKAAVNTENFAGVRSAYLDLSEITYQLNEMNIGIAHAIHAVQEEFKR